MRCVECVRLGARVSSMRPRGRGGQPPDREQATSLLCHASVRPTWGSPSQAWDDHESPRAYARKGTHVSGMEARTHLLTVSGGLRVTTRAGHLACVLVQEHTSLQGHVPSGAARDVAARGHWKPDWVREIRKRGASKNLVVRQTFLLGCMRLGPATRAAYKPASFLSWPHEACAFTLVAKACTAGIECCVKIKHLERF
jgi:hypothetical protein